MDFDNDLRWVPLHSVVSLPGKFHKTLALNVAAELVPNAHDTIFLFDLHIDVPADIMDSVRMVSIFVPL